MTATIHTLNPPGAAASELAGEADHRIANSLSILGSLVRMRARDGAKLDPQVALREVADRIETIAQLHRFVAHSPGATVPLSRYLHEICDRLTSALTSTGASCSVDCPLDGEIASGQAMSFGLISAELISNSLKYAHPAGTPLKFSLNVTKDGPSHLNYLYEDDGVGFPEDFNMNAKGHLGMRFIQALSKKLNTTPQWRSDGLGVAFEMRVPV